MEASDPFGQAAAGVADDPFDGQSVEDMADPGGFGESPESELGGEPANGQLPSEVLPVVDREGNPVAGGSPAPAEVAAEAAPDPTPDTSTPSAGSAAPAAEPADAGQSATAAETPEAPVAQEAPSQAEPSQDATEPVSAGSSTPEPAETPSEAPAPEAAKPKRQARKPRKAAAKGDPDGPRGYQALYQTAKGQWTELPLTGTAASAEIAEHVVENEDGLWIEANNVDQARRLAYVAAGRPRDGIRLVLVAEKSWQPKTVKPRVVPAREALEIS